jgi:hypothetical protein
MTITASTLFPGLPEVERARRFEEYKDALDKSALVRNARMNAEMAFDQATATWTAGRDAVKTAAVQEITKTVGADTLVSLRDSLSKIDADLTKDISITSPLSTGLVPYDLEAPAKFLIPAYTPVRNRTPRVKGQGLTRRIKQITGISNSGTGGVARLSPFLADTTTDTFAGLTLQRPKKISYNAADVTFNYKQGGLSDSVLWSAEFAGQGFQDPRQLSQTSLLLASMLAEELALIGGRGTDAGVYLGAPSAPTVGNFTGTVRTANTGEVGNTANIASLTFKIAWEGIFGTSAASAASSAITGMSAATGKVVDITVTAGSVPAGVTGYVVYASIDATNYYQYGRSAVFSGTSGFASGYTQAGFTLQFTGGGTGGAIITGTTAPGADTTSSANAYDGLLTVQLDPARSGGILNVSPLGGAAQGFSTSNPGVEFQNLFAALYVGGVNNVTGTITGGSGVKARPNVVWLHALDRKQLSDALKIGASTNPAFIYTSQAGTALNPNDPSYKLGGMVSGIYNELTGDLLDINVHPYFNQGVALVMSEQLPIPNSEVSNTTYVAGPQDYMAINWPVISNTYDVSTYWFNALIHAAPMFSGALMGIAPR